MAPDVNPFSIHGGTSSYRLCSGTRRKRDIGPPDSSDSAEDEFQWQLGQRAAEETA